MTDATKTERDELLDELTDALNTWYEKEAEAITKEIAFVKQVVTARSSAAGAVKSNTRAARILVINDITSFLAGTG